VENRKQIANPLDSVHLFFLFYLFVDFVIMQFGRIYSNQLNFV